MAWLNLLESMEYLKKRKISVLVTKAISRKELEKFKDFPYVLKLSSNLIHKTESKAIITDIYSKEALFSAVDHLENVLKKEKTKGKVVIQKQVKGLELIIGINNDAQFGKVIVFGKGGIYTEQEDDTVIRILPITKKEIEEMIYSTKISKYFFARGKSYAISKLILLLEKVCNMGKDKNLLELDLNPVILTEKEAYVLDVRINKR